MQPKLMMFPMPWRAFAAIIVLASAPAVSSPATAQTAPLATGEMVDGDSWAVAEVSEATRKDGVLTITVRLKAGEGVRNNKNIWFYRTQKDGYDEIYVLAGKKKYFALKDSEGTPLIPDHGKVSMDDGKGRAIWTARFPAPPVEIKDVSLTLPLTSALDSIPITDR